MICLFIKNKIYLDITINKKYKISMQINFLKIEKERKRYGWSYTRLAEEIGISKQRLSFILGLKYKRNTFRTIEMLAKALNVDPKDLIL